MTSHGKPSLHIPLNSLLAILPVLLVLLMTVMDVTVVNVALPVLADNFAISDSAAVWIITIYQLVITMLLLPVSACGERYGFRKIFLFGTFVFTLASLGCAVGNSFAWIVTIRGLQGIGAACIMGVNIALTRLIYPPKLLGRGMALNAMVIAVATAGGPTVAGAILSCLSWHWLFIINIPLGIAAFIIGKKKLPDNPRCDEKGDKEPTQEKPDSYSILGNMVVFGLIFYSLGLFSRRSDFYLAIFLLVLGLCAGVFYIKRQLKIKNPILPVDLLKKPLFSLCILTSVASFIAQNIAMISLPFLFHNRYDFSEITTGLLMTPWSLATMAVAPIAARLIERFHPGRTASFGMVLYAFGILMLLILPEGRCEEWQIVWRMIICGIGFGLFQTPNNVVMVMATPLKRSGSAGGMQSTARLTGQTLGATLVTLLFALTNADCSIQFCLITAMAFALAAAALSLLRKIEQKSIAG